MIRSLLFATCACTTITAATQNWIVNQPLEFQVSAVTVYGGGCFPSTQAILSFNVPPVDGVTYYYKVIGITTDGEYTMDPGPAGALQIDDLIPVSVQNNMVFNSGEFGGLEMEVWAVGTPTTEGQAHPCAQNDLWMSNLLLCNEGLNAIVQTNCVTEVSTGIQDILDPAFSYVTPSAENGYILQLNGAAITIGRVIDMQGRTIGTLSGLQRNMDLSAQPSGAYVIAVEDQDGRSHRQTFTMVH